MRILKGGGGGVKVYSTSSCQNTCKAILMFLNSRISNNYINSLITYDPRSHQNLNWKSKKKFEVKKKCQHDKPNSINFH